MGAGLVIDLLAIMAARLNFTYDLFFPADGKWGGADANGTWNGMVKHILDGVRLPFLSCLPSLGALVTGGRRGCGLGDGAHEAAERDGLVPALPLHGQGLHAQDERDTRRLLSTLPRSTPHPRSSTLEEREMGTVALRTGRLDDEPRLRLRRHPRPLPLQPPLALRRPRPLHTPHQPSQSPVPCLNQLASQERKKSVQGGQDEEVPATVLPALSAERL